MNVSDISLDLGCGAEHHVVDEHREEGACKRADDHDPEIRPCIAREEGRAKAARRVDGAVVDGDADDIHQAKGKTDCKTGELAETLLRVGGAKHHKHEDHCEENLHQQSHPLADAGLTHIGGKIIAGRGRDAAILEGRTSHVEEPEKE